MAYRDLDHLTWADTAFEATGETLEALFHSAGEALIGVMVSDPSQVLPKEKRQVVLRAGSPQALLHAFLEKLVFYKDAERLLLLPHALLITPLDGTHVLEAELYGEKIDPKRHDCIVDVKAVTHHEFRLERLGDHWRAQVVLDV